MRSSIKGVVVKRGVELGAIVQVGDVLLTLADPKELWFLGNIYEQDIQKIQKGQILKLRTESFPDQEFNARANYIAPAIDPETRALVIRCDVENKNGILRSDMFVSAKLVIGEADAIVLPQSAIVRVREMRFVLAKVGPTLYRRYRVDGYDLDGKRFAVTRGIDAGLNILVDGAVLLNDRFSRQEE
jgi:Cu(I)/Ag(I) efflux system membrane fusion protein